MLKLRSDEACTWPVLPCAISVPNLTMLTASPVMLGSFGLGTPGSYRGLTASARTLQSGPFSTRNRSGSEGLARLR